MAETALKKNRKSRAMAATVRMLDII